MESEEDDIFDEEEIKRDAKEGLANLPIPQKIEEFTYYSDSLQDSNFFIKIEVDDIKPKIEPTEEYEEVTPAESCNSQQLEALFERKISKRNAKFMCILCRKRFQNASARNSHFSTHFGFSVTRKKIRSCSWFFGKHIFTCNFCGRFYLRKGDILNHCRTYFFASKIEKHLATENKSVIQNILNNIICENNIPEFLYETSKIKLEPEDTPNISTSEEIPPHQCGYCLKEFKTNDDLAFHLQCGENIFNCPICSKRFAEKEGLKSHLLLHNKQKLFKCVFCSKRFMKLTNLQLHVTLHAISKKYKCEVCLKRFFDETQLIYHKTCHSLFKFKQFSKKKSLDYHSITHDPTKSQFECKTCSKLFSHANHLKLHMRVHTNNSQKKCRIGSKQFSTHKNLKQHAIAHQNRTSFNCKVCNRLFKSKTSLINHVCDNKCDEFFSAKNSARSNNFDASIEVFPCDVCPREFASKLHLEDHQLSHSRDKPHQCQICLKQYRYVQDLNRHVRNHTGEKPFACDVCFKRFAHRGHLNRHMYVLHDGPKPRTLKTSPKDDLESLLPGCVDGRFACDFCGLEFSKKATLNYHLLSHSSFRFVCADCSKEFKRKGDLRRHIMKVHLRVRSISCTVCDKAFQSNWELKVHLRIHTGERPHQCQLCDNRFTVIQNLRSHIRKRHSDVILT